MKTEIYIAKVIIPIPVDEPFTYTVSPEMQDLVAPGIQVIVPFGERYAAGIVLETGMDSTFPDVELKPVLDIVDPEPYVGTDLLALLSWIADYYVCHLGEACRLIQPAVNLQKGLFEIRRLPGKIAETLPESLEVLLSRIPETGWILINELASELREKNIAHRIHRLRRRGLLETRYLPPRTRKIYKTIDQFALQPVAEWSPAARKKYRESEAARYESGRTLIRYLASAGESDRNGLAAAGFSSGLIRRLEKEQVLLRREQQVSRQQTTTYYEKPADGPLTVAQQKFVDLAAPFINEKRTFQPFLLHGITGSGKTRIYIELIRRVLEKGEAAIVLVPEIVLTPQTMARFYHHFGSDVAVLHSRISGGERLEILQKAREGKIRVVLGPRSAVFVPFRNLGIIIVDEEHEGSYKQSDAQPRYHAREVALYRAHLNRIPVILGSATPSLESYYNAQQKKYIYYHLDERIKARRLPRTMVVDAGLEWRRNGAETVISEFLVLQLEARLLVREQAMLLQNRRGFSPYIQCHECAFVVKCPNCDITLTYHAEGRQLRCHYCGHMERAPHECPECGGIDILYKGVGTQRIEQITGELFPYARLLRMDQDTTRRKDDHARILERFRNREADFLIGTKMIAKGLDFGNVTLVGILNADQGLHFPDFRAAEKTFQLLVQAAGRAGRGTVGGEVLIQAYDCNHYLFHFLPSQDVRRFFQRELETRKTLNYPPFSRLCLVRVTGEKEDAVTHFAGEIARFLHSQNGERSFQVLGPAPAPIVRINNRYRYQLLIKQSRRTDPAMTRVRRLLKEGIYKNPEIRKWPVDVAIDVDPVEIL